MMIAKVATGGIGEYLAVKLTLADREVATIARGSYLEAPVNAALPAPLSPFREGGRQCEQVLSWL